jgi:ADP-ribose pyrophosphatase
VRAILASMKETILATGKIFELVQVPIGDGRMFEVARRAPGVRVIIADKVQKKVLLNKEFRHELKGYDYRLPGGKVFDTLPELDAFRKSKGDMTDAAAAKAKEEAAEEAGIAVESVTFFRKSTLGATVEWDLYVFEATKWDHHKDGQQLKDGEEVDGVFPGWYDFADAEQMIIDGQMQEERIALILLQWLKGQHEV